MNFKRLVLTILILAAGIAPLFAQQSAQATMKVQVTIVEGNSITMAPNKTVYFKTHSDKTSAADLTTISIDKQPNTVIVLSRPDKLNLYDEGGTNLELPVIYSDQDSEEELKSNLSVATTSEKRVSKGSYRGSITTSIAYL